MPPVHDTVHCSCLDVLHHLNLGVVQLDQQCRIQLWNQWLQRHSGLSQAQALEHRLDAVMQERLHQRLLDAIDEALQRRRSRLLTHAVHGTLMELQQPGKDEAIAVNVAVTPMNDEQGDRACLLQLTDVTAAIRREQKLHQEIYSNRRSSLVDDLTGLLNRRAFDSWLSAEWRRSEQVGEPLTCMMVDVDHFKLFNDLSGHQAGDDCLRRIAAVMQHRITRPGDAVFRYGGEEFAILLTTTDRRGAEVVAQSLLEVVRAQQLVHPENGSFVSISIGYSSCVPGAGTDAETLVEQADMALYLAKQGGRDRACADDGSAITDIDMAVAGRKSKIADRSLVKMDSHSRLVAF